MKGFNRFRRTGVVGGFGIYDVEHRVELPLASSSWFDPSISPAVSSDTRLAGRNENFLVHANIFAAPLIVESRDWEKTEALEERLTFGIAVANGALEQSGRARARATLYLAQERFGVAFPSVSRGYRKVKHFKLIPLHFLELHNGDNVAIFCAAKDVVGFLPLHSTAIVLNGQLIAAIQQSRDLICLGVRERHGMPANA